MYDPLHTGHRLARRTAVWQAGTTALLALMFLLQGVPHAFAVVVGGAAMLVGGAIAARLMVGGGVQAAAGVVIRWFAGVILKWGVVLVVVPLAMAVWGLPPVPLLAGVIAALVAQMLALSRR
ncbi:hypothetical protein [Marilutibacter alkalisoli]|uniref:ATP synthase subunit I n=1 Tax=Marilutibacter alkalisoli TaxID=2591633 RepID=A0A514BPR0_9GAMM|nr:hypothetical protein [Lysobacter alkalisoli]QDH69009.1 hypothetical protein FKV23_01995 [Lysobacter alkalisoli]